MVITVRGKPVADLVPHDSRKSEEPGWLSPSEVLAIREIADGDPTFRTDLDRLTAETTDDLGPIW
jgi:antitoxin (DNA-binding transcriptional repressor) of toxin-antitoxin stability system